MQSISREAHPSVDCLQRLVSKALFGKEEVGTGAFIFHQCCFFSSLKLLPILLIEGRPTSQVAREKPANIRQSVSELQGWVSNLHNSVWVLDVIGKVIVIFARIAEVDNEFRQPRDHFTRRLL